MFAKRMCVYVLHFESSTYEETWTTARMEVLRADGYNSTRSGIA